MEELKDRLIQSLLNVLEIKAVSGLKIFLEGEVAVLFAIDQNKRAMSPSELADSLEVTKGRITALINSLNKKRYINIQISPIDRRSFSVALTKEGAQFLKQKQVSAEGYFDRMLEKIGNEKSVQLIEIIEEIVDKMKEE